MCVIHDLTQNNTLFCFLGISGNFLFVEDSSCSVIKLIPACFCAIVDIMSNTQCLAIAYLCGCGSPNTFL